MICFTTRDVSASVCHSVIHYSFNETHYRLIYDAINVKTTLVCSAAVVQIAQWKSDAVNEPGFLATFSFTQRSTLRFPYSGQTHLLCKIQVFIHFDEDWFLKISGYLVLNVCFQHILQFHWIAYFEMKLNLLLPTSIVSLSLLCKCKDEQWNHVNDEWVLQKYILLHWFSTYQMQMLHYPSSGGRLQSPTTDSKYQQHKRNHLITLS